MKAGIFYGPFDVRVEEVPDPKIEHPTDAIVKITHTCICGSDLWWYRGITKKKVGSRTGHEFMGRIVEVGGDVKKIQVGDLVVGPFSWCDGTCYICKAGMSSACLHGGGWARNGMDGCQGEMLRVPFADANLFIVPKSMHKEELIPSLLALSDVMCTGHHAAILAGVSKNSIVAVIGDGAVGLCAVLASRRLGANRIIFLSNHDENSRIGKQFGATDMVTQRAEQAIEKVKALTDNIGVDCVLECVGTPEARNEAFEMVRAGGRIAFVGLPENAPDIKSDKIFWKNITVGGGPSPAATYIPLLMPDVLTGKLDPSPIFNMKISLADLAKGYEAMDKRKAIKVLIILGE